MILEIVGSDDMNGDGAHNQKPSTIFRWLTSRRIVDHIKNCRLLIFVD